jgi:hypothetical protein
MKKINDIDDDDDKISSLEDSNGSPPRTPSRTPPRLLVKYVIRLSAS